MTAPPRPSKKVKRPAQTQSFWRTTAFKTVAASVLAASVLAGASLLIYRMSGPQKSTTAEAAPRKQAEPAVYYDFPKVTVILKDARARAAHSATIQVSAEFDNPSALLPSKAAQPRIVDSMQTFLRERSWEELQGRSGTDLLRTSMLQIVNASIAPHRANQVLFKQILIE